jgi:hypothetical protein
MGTLGGCQCGKKQTGSQATRAPQQNGGLIMRHGPEYRVVLWRLNAPVVEQDPIRDPLQSDAFFIGMSDWRPADVSAGCHQGRAPGFGY